MVNQGQDNKLMLNLENLRLNEIRRLEKEINNGNATCNNYYELFSNYNQLKANQVKNKLLLDVLAQKVIEAGREEISSKNIQETTLINMAHIYEYKNDSKNALHCYNFAVKKFPNLAAVYLARGLFYYDNKKRNLADIDFNKAIELDPSNAEIIYVIRDSETLNVDNESLMLKVKITCIICIIVIIYSIYEVFSALFPLIKFLLAPVILN